MPTVSVVDTPAAVHGWAGTDRLNQSSIISDAVVRAVSEHHPKPVHLTLSLCVHGYACYRHLTLSLHCI